MQREMEPERPAKPRETPPAKGDPPRPRRRVGPEDEERGQQTDCEDRHDD